MARTPAAQTHWAEELALGLVKEQGEARDQRARTEADQRALIALVCAEGPPFLDRLAGALIDAVDYFNRVLNRTALRVARTEPSTEAKASGVVVLKTEGGWLFEVRPSWRDDDPDPSLRVTRHDSTSYARFRAGADGALTVDIGGAELNADQLAEALVRGSQQALREIEARPAR